MSRYKEFSNGTLRQLHSDGLSDREIAERVGVSRSAVSQRRRALGLEPNRPYNADRRKKFTDAQLRELHGEGLSDRKIARILGVSKKSVWERRQRLGLEPNHPYNYRAVDRKINGE